jgi:hypothetical protein
MFLALMLAAAAPAEAEIGGAASVEERQGLHLAGQCIVNERSKEVRALLAMDFRDTKYGRRMHNLVNGGGMGCRGVNVPRGVYKAGGLLWAGSLAEWLLRRDRMLDNLAAHTDFKPELPTIEARNAGEYLAYCLVRTNPQGAAAMLRTDPATSQELDALKAIGPSLSACVPANSKSEFTRESLRALLALGAQRLAAHNEGGSSSSRESAK